MTNEEMSAKKYLDRYRDAVNQVLNLEGQAMQLKRLAGGVSPDLSKEKAPSNHISDPTGEIGAKLADISEEIASAVSEAIDILAEVRHTINDVEDAVSRRLLHLRFIERRTWEAIAAEMNISFRHVFRVRERALREAYYVIECHS